MGESQTNIATPLTAEASAPARRKPRIESQRLFQGNSEIVIVHHDEEYSLRITKNGKLILIK
jgi:hemin uptake protein HemP